jgi:hypothetical protein
MKVSGRICMELRYGVYLKNRHIQENQTFGVDLVDEVVEEDHVNLTPKRPLAPDNQQNTAHVYSPPRMLPQASKGVRRSTLSFSIRVMPVYGKDTERRLPFDDSSQITRGCAFVEWARRG